MLAARRAGCVARQLQRPARTYASEAHGHHKSAPVNESFGTGSLITVASFFGLVAFYQMVPAKGEESSLTSFINKYLSRSEDWEEINSARTKAFEQAGYDRNLFEHAGSTGAAPKWVDVRFPESLQAHSPRNVSAGQLIHLDHVVEHYKQAAAKEEEVKAMKLSQKKE